MGCMKVDDKASSGSESEFDRNNWCRLLFPKRRFSDQPTPIDAAIELYDEHNNVKFTQTATLEE